MNIDLFLTLIYFLLSLPFGLFLIIPHFKNKEVSSFGLIMFGEILGVCISALFIFYLSHLFPINISSILVLLLGLFLLIYLYFKNKFKFYSINLLNKKSISIILFNLFWLATFSLIIFNTHLKPLDAYLNGSPSTFGDFPFHLGLITNFAYRDNFPPVNPVFSSSVLSYHFMADFISSVLISVGSTLRGSIIYPSIVLGLLTVNSMYVFLYKVFKRKIFAFVPIYLFLFNGGFSFIRPLLDGNLVSSFFNGTIRFSHFAEIGVDYPNILSEILMTERALFMGIPLWIMSIYFIYLWFINNKKGPLILGGISTALLPFANIYAILVNSFLIIFLCIYKYILKGDKIDFRVWINFALIVLIVSFPITKHMLDRVIEGEKFIRVSFFEWPPMSLFQQKIFWLNNFGLTFVLFLFSLLLIFIKKERSYIFFILLSINTFIAHIIVFQPYAWDNNRFIIYPYFGICVVSSYFICKLLIYKNHFIKTVGLLLFVVATLTGILTTINDSQMSYPLFTSRDIKRSESIRKITDPHGIFLSAGNHNNIISSLTGRRLILGYSGYLWTHGISNTEEIENDINIIYSGDPNTDFLITKNNIRYIFISGWETNEFPNLNSKKLVSLYKVIYEDESVKVLDTSLKLNPPKLIDP